MMSTAVNSKRMGGEGDSSGFFLEAHRGATEKWGRPEMLSKALCNSPQGLSREEEKEIQGERQAVSLQPEVGSPEAGN